MKKLLLLGGSAQQVVAIETAKRLGLYTVLCDYLSDNPGQYHADKFYLTSTTDKDAVLEVAKQERVDGVLAYASDPAALTAAYVAEKLGLPGSPYESVEILCNKDRFRQFLAEHDFCTPKAKGYADLQEAIADLRNGCYMFPVIVKPVDSSGSKGATVLPDLSNVTEALEFAVSFSRSKRFIVEEFIEKKHPYLIGGDIFVLDGKVVMWGLLNCHRDTNVNPLVPVGKSYPLALSNTDVERVKECLQRLVSLLRISSGAMNVELVIDKNDQVWPIDIGPRSGGNMIPDLLGMIFDTDVVELTVRAAMGEKVSLTTRNATRFYATHNLHSRTSGVYDSVIIAPQAGTHLVKECLYKKAGDRVEFFDNASKALGILFLKFDSMEQMLHMMDHSDEWIKVNIKTGGGVLLSEYTPQATFFERRWAA